MLIYLSTPERGRLVLVGTRMCITQSNAAIPPTKRTMSFLPEGHDLHFRGQEINAMITSRQYLIRLRISVIK